MHPEPVLRMDERGRAIAAQRIARRNDPYPWPSSGPNPDIAALFSREDVADYNFKRAGYSST